MVRPLGWANHASAFDPSSSPSRPVPAKGATVPRSRSSRPDLVGPGHRDVEDAILQREVPGRAQRRRPAGPTRARPQSLLPGSGERRYDPGLEIDGADRVVFGIRNVQPRAQSRHALRLLKLGAVRRPITKPRDTGAVGPLDRAVQPGGDDAVMVAVGDEQRVPNRQYLAGEAQGAGRLANFLERDGRRSRMKQTAVLELLQHPGDDRIELFEGQFALVLSDDAALRVDEHQGRPGTPAEALPDRKVPVVDDRVFDAISEHGFSKVGRLALSVKFRGVDADHDHAVPVFPFDLPQLRKRVHAVDSTEGPKIDDRQPPAQVGDVQRPGNVEPVEPIREVRGANRTGVGLNRHPVNATGDAPRLSRQP